MKCRYCLEQTGDFAFPCSCKNPVHPKCLIKWRKISRRTSCEICNDQWDHVQTKNQKLYDWSMFLIKASPVLLVTTLFIMMKLKTILKVAVIFLVLICMLSAVNIIVLVPFSFLVPILSPISIYSCLFYIAINVIHYLDAQL